MHGLCCVGLYLGLHQTVYQMSYSQLSFCLSLKQQTKEKTFIICVSVCMTAVCVQACVPLPECGGQSNCPGPSSFYTRVPGIKRRPSDLAANDFSTLSHLAGRFLVPLFVLKIDFTEWPRT